MLILLMMNVGQYKQLVQWYYARIVLYYHTYFLSVYIRSSCARATLPSTSSAAFGCLNSVCVCFLFLGALGPWQPRISCLVLLFFLLLAGIYRVTGEGFIVCT